MAEQAARPAQRRYVMIGKFSRREAGEMKTYRRGDTIDLEPALAERMRDRVRPYVGTEPLADAPSEPAPQPHKAVGLTVPEAERLIEEVTTSDELDAIEASEKEHPKVAGGRAGVLRAIRARRAELAGV